MLLIQGLIGVVWLGWSQPPVTPTLTLLAHHFAHLFSVVVGMADDISSIFCSCGTIHDTQDKINGDLGNRISGSTLEPILMLSVLAETLGVCKLEEDLHANDLM